MIQIIMNNYYYYYQHSSGGFYGPGKSGRKLIKLIYRRRERERERIIINLT